MQGLRTLHTHTHKLSWPGGRGALVPCGHATTERNCIACSRGLKHEIPASRRLSIYTYRFPRLWWSDPITYVVYVYLYIIYTRWWRDSVQCKTVARTRPHHYIYRTCERTVFSFSFDTTSPTLPPAQPPPPPSKRV